jgi:glycosyltransferase involved in cell wall biosynthesis
MASDNIQIIKKVGIIIPAFNPDISQLTELVERIKNVCQQLKYQLIIVDDGSQNWKDIEGLKDNNVYLLKHSQNLGKGAALKTGFDYLLADNSVEIVITLDADLQHPPEKIPEFLTAFFENDWDIIVGYRRRDLKIMPFHRIISNTLTSLTISLLSGQMIRDSQCGFRLIDSRVIKRLKLTENRFHLESELLLRASFFKYKIGFVPIPTIYTDQKSSINNIADTLNFIFLLLRIIKERVAGKCLKYNEKKCYKNM